MSRTETVHSLTMTDRVQRQEPATATPWQQLSSWQRLDLYMGLGQVGLGAAYTAMTAYLRPASAPAVLKSHVLLSTMRHMFMRLEPAQIQYLLNGRLEANYLAWAAQQKVKASSVTLRDGTTKAFWIGNPKADNILLYYPGGGFVIPGGPGHISHAASIVDHATKSGKSLAALILQYDLANQSQHPRQLRQAVDLVHYALDDLGKRPSQIVLAGDSAGGTVILGMLGHALHPLPDVPPLKLQSPLRAVALSSPWVNLACDGPRYKTDHYYDSVHPATLAAWGDLYLGGRRADNYTSPVLAGSDWWKGLGKVVKEVVIEAGGREMMLDDIEKVGRDIAAAHPKTTTSVTPGGVHAEAAHPPMLRSGDEENSHYLGKRIAALDL